MCKWESKIDFYYHLLSKGLVKAQDIAPNVEGFKFYIDAFTELSTCRPSGFGLSAIPFVSIVEYAKLYGILEDEFHEFLDIIRAMDAELLRSENSKNKAKPNGKTDKGNKGRNRH